MRRFVGKNDDDSPTERSTAKTIYELQALSNHLTSCPSKKKKTPRTMP